MFSKKLLQAINDWQRGGSPKQKKKRGNELKILCSALPEKFKKCHLVTYRQIALEKGILWKLADELFLPETISGWTSSLNVAREFKGGVPPAGIQGVIFALLPQKEKIIVNLDLLYRDKAFLEAIEDYRTDIDYFYDGIGRYNNTQSEIIIEINKVNLTDICELGGFSGTREELIREMYGPNPSQQQILEFDRALKKTGEKLGACWIGNAAKDRVIKKIMNEMPRLRTIKHLQEISF